VLLLLNCITNSINRSWCSVCYCTSRRNIVSAYLLLSCRSSASYRKNFNTSLSPVNMTTTLPHFLGTCSCIYCCNPSKTSLFSLNPSKMSLFQLLHCYIKGLEWVWMDGWVCFFWGLFFLSFLLFGQVDMDIVIK
jgi:hypothetical protein